MRLITAVYLIATWLYLASLNMVLGQAHRCSLPRTRSRCSAQSPYRTYDGSCNNLRHPSWGQSGQTHKRMLPAQNDENGTIRSTSVGGGKLPSPRKVSTSIYQLAGKRDLSRKHTTMIWLWGQFLDHDITSTPHTNLRDCCSNPNSKDCIPIPIPSDDPFWGSKGKTCMNLVRSRAIGPGQCGLRSREQINDQSSYIDASMVYGPNSRRARELRQFTGGKLKTSGDGLLPVDRKGTDCMIPARGHPDKRCFAAGDDRSTEWIGLTSLHTVFLREHNRIAEKLYDVLKFRDPVLRERDLDEIVYQETRKIISAYIQAITYRDYLPRILGRREMRRYRLGLGRPRYRVNYDATVANVFATAAFRFGHSQIAFGTQPKRKDYRNATDFITMTEAFHQPMTYRRAGQDSIIWGTCVEPAQSGMNNKFSQEVRDRLFEKSFNGNSLDLPAVNAQRGRDHGIPPYNQWRKHCGLGTASSFNNMPDHSRDLRKRFSRVYFHPDDIDLFPAGVTERPVSSDALVGPTFACLIGEQFKKLKEGDRFWFENQDYQSSPFSDWQVYQLSQVPLSKIICDNTYPDGLVPIDVFDLRSARIPCNRLLHLDLDSWM